MRCNHFLFDEVDGVGDDLLARLDQVVAQAAHQVAHLTEALLGVVGQAGEVAQQAVVAHQVVAHAVGSCRTGWWPCSTGRRRRAGRRPGSGS
jgi:hypothetical protein